MGEDVEIQGARALFSVQFRNGMYEGWRRSMYEA